MNTRYVERVQFDLGTSMTRQLSGDGTELVRCLALFLRDRREPEEIAQATVSALADRISGSICRLWLSRPTRSCQSCMEPTICAKKLHCLQLEAEAPQAGSDALQSTPFGVSMPGLAAAQGEEVACRTYTGYTAPEEREWTQSLGVPNFLGYPLRSDGRLLGVLGLYRDEPFPLEVQNGLSTAALVLSQALGAALTRSEQTRTAQRLEDNIEKKTEELRSRVSELEKARLAMLNMMSESFDTQRQLRALTEKLEVMVDERTKELVAAKEEAEHANLMKSRFLSRVSHEFRTPMHGIISFAKIGIQRIDAIDRKKTLLYFNQILESAGELLPLIDDLLDISRIEAGKVDYNFESNDLRSLVFDIAGKYEPLFAERELQIRVSVSDDFPKSIRFDRKHLRQALTNILGNAGKFSTAKSEVEIELSSQGDSIEIAIADRGPGIPPGEEDAIFDVFSQSSTTRGSFEGAGLGLAITHAIVLSHDGAIRVENREEGGARFRIQLPIGQSIATRESLEPRS